MAPILSYLISSGPKKKEPRYVCLSEAKTSHSHKIWTEVSSSVPHFLQAWLLLSPIIYRCLLKVSCPVRRPITTLDCVLLKDNNRALIVLIFVNDVLRMYRHIFSRPLPYVGHNPSDSHRCSAYNC